MSVLDWNQFIVCGSRDGQPVWGLVERALAQFDRDVMRIDHVIVGSRRGTDGAALRWADDAERVNTCVPARWKTGGGKRAEGPRRNERMPALFPNVRGVLAFPGGDGTEGMVAIAKRLHIRAWRCTIRDGRWLWQEDM